MPTVRLGNTMRVLVAATLGAISLVAVIALILQAHGHKPALAKIGQVALITTHSPPAAAGPSSPPTRTAGAHTSSDPVAAGAAHGRQSPRRAPGSGPAPTAAPGRVSPTTRPPGGSDAATRAGHPSVASTPAAARSGPGRTNVAGNTASGTGAERTMAAGRDARRAVQAGPDTVAEASVTRSHYLRTLTGGPADAAPMRALGVSDARHNRAGQTHVVLLDIGGQAGDGVRLSSTTTWVSYQGLANAVIAYARGYHSAQPRHSPVTIAIGTNNDLAVSAATGREWAERVVGPVATATRGLPAMTIAGADDIEPGFAAGPTATRAWVSGFLAATHAPLVFNGSADGCSATAPGSLCHRGWTAADLAWVAGTAAPKRITALPQIYNITMARQWAMISLTAVRDGDGPLRFHGPLTENAACRGVANCPTMNSRAAWRALWDNLQLHPAIAPRSMPARTDLDVR